MSCIFENTSTIDDLKKKSGMTSIEEELKGDIAGSRSGWENLKEVMGGQDKSPDIWWIFPTTLERELVIEKEFD
jgi:hypothetical protein